MITSIDYRRRARECLQLAETSTDLFVKVALAELAQEFDQAAEEAERIPRHKERDRRPSDRRAALSAARTSPM